MKMLQFIIPYKNLFFIFISLITFSCTQAQPTQKVAICKEKQGCEIAELSVSKAEIDIALGKSQFFSTSGDNSILVLKDCMPYIETKLTEKELHLAHDGQGEPKRKNSFDIRKYLSENGCFSCPNTTKKIAFAITSPEHSGSGYFYLNLKAGEAFMPNAAFQQFYAGKDGTSEMVVDAFFRNYQYVSYIIAEGNKVVSSMPIGTDMINVGSDKENAKRFKTDFQLTGKKRNSLKGFLEQIEYTGKDDEGKAISVWLVPVSDVCLPKDKFDAWGFWNLGYLNVEGITYLVTEISGSGFKMQVTGVEEGSYNFNPVGYTSY